MVGCFALDPFPAPQHPGQEGANGILHAKAAPLCRRVRRVLLPFSAKLRDRKDTGHLSSHLRPQPIPGMVVPEGCRDELSRRTHSSGTCRHSQEGVPGSSKEELVGGGGWEVWSPPSSFSLSNFGSPGHTDQATLGPFLGFCFSITSFPMASQAAQRKPFLPFCPIWTIILSFSHNPIIVSGCQHGKLPGR